jgi:hypothetical protein
MPAMRLQRILPINTMRPAQTSPEELASRGFPKRLGLVITMPMMNIDHTMVANGA